MDGTLHTVDGRQMLRFERRLAHPAGKVWRAITDPTELSGWFPWQLEIDFRVGGKIGFTHPTGAATAPDAVITELDPPHVFGYQWNDGDLRWELTPEDDGCVLVFTHTFAERPPAAKFAAGWHVSLDALEAVLSGSPGSAEGWAELNARYVRSFGLLDGELDGRELRFEQELVFAPSVVWEALVGSVGSVDATAQAGESLGYPWMVDGREVGVVRFTLVPQDFGTRLVLTLNGPGAELATARAGWRDWLESFARKLHGRG